MVGRCHLYSNLVVSLVGNALPEFHFQVGGWCIERPPLTLGCDCAAGIVMFKL